MKIYPIFFIKFFFRLFESHFFLWIKVSKKEKLYKSKGAYPGEQKLAPSKAFKLYERLHMKKGFGIKGRNKRKKNST